MKKKVLLISVLFVAIGGTLALLLPWSKPHYCWLVFGPKGNLRVLVCINGNKVRIDRDGVGQFSGKIDDCQDVMIADPDNRTTYLIARMSRFYDNGSPRRTSLLVSVNVKGSLRYSQYCDVELVASSHDAKEAHFHGPLTVEPVKANWKLPPDLALHRGDKPTSLRVTVGTMDAERGCWVVVRTQGKEGPAFPKGVHPIVDVEFPSKHKGAPSIKLRYPLDEPC